MIVKGMPSLRDDYTDWRRLLSDIMTALDEEYKLAQRICGGVSYSLRDGMEVSSEAGRYIYRFRMDLDKTINFIDAPVKIRDGPDRQIDGEILSIDGDIIVLSLKERPSNQNVEMIIDLSFLLIELKKKLRAYRDHYTPRLSALPLKVFGYKCDIGNDIPLDESLNDQNLNEEQRGAILNASRYEVSIICGPPGTGKSKVLACIAVEAMKRSLRVLIATHTHSALDRALRLIVEELQRTGLNMGYGSIIRLGKALDQEIAKFEEDMIIINLSEELRKEFLAAYEVKKWYEETLNKWYRECGSIISAAKTIYEHIVLLGKEVGKLMRKLQVIEQYIEALNQELHHLEEEYQRISRSIISRFLKRKLNKLEIRINDEYRKLRALERLRNMELNRLSDAGSRLEGALSRLRTILDKGLRSEVLERLSTYDATIQYQYSYDEAVEIILKNAEWLADFMRMGGTEKINERIQILSKRLEEIDNRIKEMRNKVRRKARLIASTLTKCMTELFDQVMVGAIPRFNIALIDEVSMANLGLLWVASSIADRVVLFGDPNQLPPITLLDEKDHGRLYQLQFSNLFDWLGISYDNSAPHTLPTTFLRKQYRMGKRICEIVSNMFYGGGLESMTRHDGTVIFYNMDDAKSIDMRTPSGSRVNGLNALLVAKIVEELRREGVEEGDIAVVTPYRDQARLIRGVLRSMGFDAIRVGTVHTFQGGERKAVILDLVVQHKKVLSRSPLLGKKEMVNKLLSTSMSRAIEKLIIIGGWSTLKSSRIKLFKELLSLLSPQEVKTPSLDTILSIPIKRLQTPSNEEYFFSINEVYDALKKDISEAKKYIVIVSPFVKHDVLLDIVSHAKAPVTIYTRRGEEKKINFEELPKNVHIEVRGKIHSKVALIDDNITYIGSLNFLSPTGSLETVCRIQGWSRGIAKIKKTFPPRF
jgi:prefoldin subunit 5